MACREVAGQRERCRCKWARRACGMRVEHVLGFKTPLKTAFCVQSSPNACHITASPTQSLHHPPPTPDLEHQALDQRPYQSAYRRRRRRPHLLRAVAPRSHPNIHYPSTPPWLITVSTCRTTTSPKTSMLSPAFCPRSHGRTSWYATCSFSHCAACGLKDCTGQRPIASAAGV